MSAVGSRRPWGVSWVAALFVVVYGGVCGAARAQIEDFRSVNVAETPPSQEVGPMFMALPAGFAIPLALDIANRQDVEIAGQTATGESVGGGVGASGLFTLVGGETYAVTETYRMTATVDALFMRGQFPVVVVVPWEFTAPASGVYAYSSAGAVRQLTVSVDGDITGSTSADAVTSSLTIDVVLPDGADAGELLTYQATFTGILDRTTTLDLVTPADPEPGDKPPVAEPPVDGEPADEDPPVDGEPVDEDPPVVDPPVDPVDEDPTIDEEPPADEEPPVDGEPGDDPPVDGQPPVDDDDNDDSPGNSGNGNGNGNGKTPPGRDREKTNKGLEKAQERLSDLAEKISAPGLEIANGRLADLLALTVQEAEAALDADDVEAAALLLRDADAIAEALEREVDAREEIAHVVAGLEDVLVEYEEDGTEPPAGLVDEFEALMAAADAAISLNKLRVAEDLVSNADLILEEIEDALNGGGFDPIERAEQAVEDAAAASATIDDVIAALDALEDVDASDLPRSLETAIRNAERAAGRAADAVESATEALAGMQDDADPALRAAAEDAVQAAVEVLGAVIDLTLALRDSVEDLAADSASAAAAARARAEAGSVGQRRAAEADLAEAEATALLVEDVIGIAVDMASVAADGLDSLANEAAATADATGRLSDILLAAATGIAAEGADAAVEELENWADGNLAETLEVAIASFEIAVETDALEAEFHAERAASQSAKEAQKSAREAARAAKRAAQEAAKAARQAEKAVERAARRNTAAAQAAADAAVASAERALEAVARAEAAAARAGREATDINDDGENNIIDLIIVAQAFGTTVEIGIQIAVADITDDGAIDIADLVLVAQGFIGGVILPVAEEVFAAPSQPAPVTISYARPAPDVLEVSLVPAVGIPASGVQFDLSYDDAVLELADVTPGAALPGAFRTVSESTPGRVTIGLASMEASAAALEGAPYARLTFHVKVDDHRLRDAVRFERIITADDRGIRRRALPSIEATSLAAAVAPRSSRLYQNYPNPFNPETWIPFQLAASADVTIRVYDMAGQVVRVLDLGRRAAGHHVARDGAAYWDGRNDNGERVASGSYVYAIEAGGYTEMRRLVVLK